MSDNTQSYYKLLSMPYKQAIEKLGLPNDLEKYFGSDPTVHISYECMQDINAYYDTVFSRNLKTISEDEWLLYQQGEDVLDSINFEEARSRVFFLEEMPQAYDFHEIDDFKVIEDGLKNILYFIQV
jgi:hypothetical protein